MIAVFPISLNDEHLALKNVKWMNELGGCKGHECMFLADARCQQAVFVLEELKKCFDHVYVFPARAEINGWPEGANYMFRTATAWLGNAVRWKHFLWLEPDAIPLETGWMDTIELEYNDNLLRNPNMVFMGDRVQVEDIPLHMSGVGVYPNPLHAFAGEAYRAHDTAWDMAGKDQIVPKAHFTKLIEHAWKHPSFTKEEELTTQIRPEAVLFHSSKDGSLIDLLQSKRRGKQMEPQPDTEAHAKAQPEKEPDKPGSPSPATQAGEVMEATRSESPSLRSQQSDFTCVSAKAPGRTEPSMVQASSGAPTCDIFIRTYPGDYEWLTYCLQSIDTYCKGFRKVTIVSPAAAPAWFDIRKDHWAGQFPMEWKVMNEETEDGYLSQQIHKLYADVITDYQADFILHVDSDTLFTRPVTPLDYFLVKYPPPDDQNWHSPWEGAKLIWYYTPYTAIETPWQPITEKFMDAPVHYEFMRRLPMMIPRWLYPKVREFCYQKHGVIISEYVRMQPHRSFSEFNALGAFAWHNNQTYKDKIEFMTTGQPMPEPLARQFFSWGGITPEVKKEINLILGGTSQEGATFGTDAGGSNPQRSNADNVTVNGEPAAQSIPNGEVKPTIADEIRYHAGRLGQLFHDKPSRKKAIVAELRKQKLVPLKFK